MPNPDTIQGNTTDTLTATGPSTVLPMLGFNGAALVVTGTGTGLTINAQVSTDNGATYDSVDVYDYVNEVTSLNITANGKYTIYTPAGTTHVRANIAAISGGSVTLRQQASSLPNPRVHTGWDRVPGSSVPAHCIYPGVNDGTNLQGQRTPSIFKTAQASAAGDTALWTPAAGKKFRLMRFKLQVPANCTLAARAIETIKLRDATTDLNLTFDVWLGQTALVVDTNPWPAILETPWLDLGNGILSATANNVLNVNLATALSNGNVRVTACGTEE
jgi:hypothetical protein